MERKGTWAAPVAAFVLLIAVLGPAYVGRYFWLSSTASGGEVVNTPIVLRIYRYAWLRDAYRPMARIESSWTGKIVDTVIIKDLTGP